MPHLLRAREAILLQLHAAIDLHSQKAKQNCMQQLIYAPKRQSISTPVCKGTQNSVQPPALWACVARFKLKQGQTHREAAQAYLSAHVRASQLEKLLARSMPLSCLYHRFLPFHCKHSMHVCVCVCVRARARTRV